MTIYHVYHPQCLLSLLRFDASIASFFLGPSAVESTLRTVASSYLLPSGSFSPGSSSFGAGAVRIFPPFAGSSSPSPKPSPSPSTGQGIRNQSGTYLVEQEETPEGFDSEGRSVLSAPAGRVVQTVVYHVLANAYVA